MRLSILCALFFNFGVILAGPPDSLDPKTAKEVIKTGRLVDSDKIKWNIISHYKGKDVRFSQDDALEIIGRPGVTITLSRYFGMNKLDPDTIIYEVTKAQCGPRTNQVFLFLKRSSDGM